MKIERLDSSFSHKQDGIVLFLALIMLIVLTLLASSASKRSTLQEKMATNLQLKNITFNAAESAISEYTNAKNKGTISSEHFLNKAKQGGESIPFFLSASGDLNSQQDDSYFLDSGKTVKAKGGLKILERCNVVVCTGYSFGQSPVGCMISEVSGEGSTGNVITKNSVVLYQVSACKV